MASLGERGLGKMSARLCSAALLLFVALAECYEHAEPIGTDASMKALVDDDQCRAGDEQCALNAIQLRGVSLAGAVEMDSVDDEAVAEVELWPFGTTEKCCRCKSGKKGWSASGKCSFCLGKVAKTRSVSSECTKKSKKYPGSKACARSCSKAVLVEEGEEDPAMLEVQEAESQQVTSEDEAVAEVELWPFGTTEKCCRCRSGTKGWSASGKCSFCSGKVAKTRSVSSECTKKSKKFPGSKACANSCSKAVLVEEGDEEVQEQ